MILLACMSKAERAAFDAMKAALKIALMGVEALPGLAPGEAGMNWPCVARHIRDALALAEAAVPPPKPPVSEEERQAIRSSMLAGFDGTRCQSCGERTTVTGGSVTACESCGTRKERAA